MNVPHPEKRRIKILTGELPATKIASLAACHPFTQQVGVYTANLDPPQKKTQLLPTFMLIPARCRLPI